MPLRGEYSESKRHQRTISNVKLKNDPLISFYRELMIIESYEFGQIVVDGKRYNKDLLIFPDVVEAGWWRKKGHRLHIADLGKVLEAKPEVLVVGTGYFGEMAVPAETRKHVESEGIDLIVQKTAKACKTFNNQTESGYVVAALHLTC